MSLCTKSRMSFESFQFHPLQLGRCPSLCQDGKLGFEPFIDDGMLGLKKAPRLLVDNQALSLSNPFTCGNAVKKVRFG